MKKLILACSLCPGDIMTMTIAVESLHGTYPGQFLTDVRTPVPDIWLNNPHITPIADDDQDAERIEMHYPQINRSNQTLINFAECYTQFLGEQIKRPLHATVNRPRLYLGDDEASWMTMIQEHWTGGKKTPYGIIVAGTKCDYTIKQWPVEYYQEVVNRTRGSVQWVQIGETNEKHNHTRLTGCISLLGETTHRMLHRLVYHAAVGVGPVTYLMHLCAAFEKPYIYLAGGREPVTFINYPKMHTLHTIGALPCCRDNACWRSRVVAVHDGDQKDKSLCDHPILGLVAPVAKCMAMIEPDEVIRIVKRTVGVAV